MAELKTKATKASVARFIASIDDDQRRASCKTVVSMMTKATKKKPVMWGTSIIGFGDHDYYGASGKPTKWFEVGCSPRKAALTLYLLGGRDEKLLARLGPHFVGGGCLYIKRIEDVHQPTLQKLIDTSVKRLRAKDKRTN